MVKRLGESHADRHSAIVIGANRDLTGFAGGVDIKAYLLERRCGTVLYGRQGAFLSRSLRFEMLVYQGVQV